MKETYEQYLARVSNLPDFTPLTHEEWRIQSNPPQPIVEEPTQVPAQRGFTSVEREHLATLAAEAEASTRFRSPEHSETVAIGIDAVENARRVKGSHSELMGDIQSRELESRQADAERQRQLEKEQADAEHRAEQARVQLISDQIRAKKVAAEAADQTVKTLEMRHV